MELETNSAILSEADRQIKSLEKENRRLKEDLASVTTLYNQLVSEGKHEKYDERRVTFLKSQLIQLERQLVIFAEALSSRSHVLMEVENCLMSTADSLRSHVDKIQRESKPNVTLSKNDLEQVIHTVESCRIKLYKNVENNTSEKLARPVKMIDKFIKSNNSKPVTLLDICSGKTDHLNLKHVAKLESQLSQLYTQLFGISKSLHSILTEEPSANISHVNAAVYKSLGGQVASTCKLLEEVNQDLLILTVLVPSAPWPLLNRPTLKDLTSERVLATLPNFQKNKASEGKVMIEALMKAVNYSLQIKNLEADVLKQEIHMHQAIYKAQMDYTEALIASLMQGYVSFERETYELLCKPLKYILDNYLLLTANANEESLRIFLESFKEQSAQISTAIDLFTPKDSNKEAFSAYGEAFQKSLHKIQWSCQKERDEKVSNLDDLRDYLQKSFNELKLMFPVMPSPSNTKNDEQTHNRINNTGDSLSTPVRTKKGATLEKDFVDVDIRSPDSVSKTKGKTKTVDCDCSCGVEKPQENPSHQHGSSSLASTPTLTRLPSLKRPTSLPRLNRRGSQECSSGANSPGSRDSTPRLRNYSSIPSSSSFGSPSTPKGVNMKKLVLVPKMPKEKDGI